jgi:hypothetical protein
MEELKRVAKRTARRGIVITDGDITILKYLHDFRLLRIEQLEALTGRTYTRVHRRLKGLFDAGFLNRIEVLQKKDIYHLGRRAVPLLLRTVSLTDEEAERRSREHELKAATLDHEMLIADTHVMLERACAGTPLQLLNWREGETIRDTFEVGAQQAVTIQPDALFELKDSRIPGDNNRSTFFVENDRSTMPIQIRPGSRRFGDKIHHYCLFIERGRPQVYGAKRFRIVTLTLTPERRDSLCAKTEAFLIKNNLTRLRFGSSFSSGHSKTCRLHRRRRSSSLYFAVRVISPRTRCCPDLQKNPRVFKWARKSSAPVPHSSRVIPFSTAWILTQEFLAVRDGGDQCHHVTHWSTLGSTASSLSQKKPLIGRGQTVSVLRPVSRALPFAG